VATATAAQSRGFARELADILLARPAGVARWATPLQLLLILLWHPLVIGAATWFGDDLIGPVSRLWYDIGLTHSYTVIEHAPTHTDAPSEPVVIALLVLLATVFTVALEGSFVYLFVRLCHRQHPEPFALVTRAWWGTCLRGTALVPVGVIALAGWHSDLGDMVAAPALALYLLTMPIWLAYRETHPRLRQRLARWRPVCPECGYSLRRLALPRCPECGHALPVATRTYRRWARPRLAWDRATRGGLPATYIRTLLTIIVCPCRAARGLLLPDRYARAVRWCVTHLLLLALIGTALGSEGSFWRYPVMKWRASGPQPWDQNEAGITTGVVATWVTQSLLAWIIMLATLPALGVALGVLWPGRHPAARRAIAKWSLYATTVLVLAFVAANAWSLIHWWQSQAGAPGRIPLNPAAPPPIILALFYAFCWARGVAANLYLQHRGVWVFLGNAVLYLVVWLLLIVVLFPAWELECLL
jgi:hypothetical protein